MARVEDPMVRSKAMTPAAVSSVPLQESPRSHRGLAIRGALLLLIGLLEGALLLFAFRIPNITTQEMLIALAAFLLVDGAVALFDAAAAGNRGSLVGEGIVSVAAGVAIFMSGSLWRPRIFPVWAIVTGLLEIVQARTPGGRTPGRLAAAIVSVLYGVFALVGPVHDRAVLILVAATFAVIAGGLRLSGALRSR